ncbi:MAG: hypothetical protein AAF208_02880 [Cyanobacteria bacterium P01_A01_bin.45]
MTKGVFVGKQDKNVEDNNNVKKYTICNDCVFYSINQEQTECTHPLEIGINCSKVVFCSSFQPLREVDSPCVTFDEE